MAKIVHVAPYQPCASGIYEACRDMMCADVLSGHEVFFVDKGNIKDRKNVFQPVGTADDRGGFKVVTSDPRELDSADIIIAHSLPHNEWLIRNQAPIIFIAHGRPLYGFRLEYYHDKASFSFLKEYSRFPRIKKLLYFWPEFTPYWESVFPKDKMLALDYPIIDQVRFSPKGEEHIIKDEQKGEYNILICDSWREDIDLFETFNGALQAAREYKNIKFHLYAIDTKEGKVNPCWEILIQEMRNLNAMGELCGRMDNMEQVYRSMDAVLTPHRIITRVIGESLSCGTPVIADVKCKMAQFGCDPHDPYSIANAIGAFIRSDKKHNIKRALKEAKHLGTEQYSQQMNKVYREILGV